MTKESRNPGPDIYQSIGRPSMPEFTSIRGLFEITDTCILSGCAQKPRNGPASISKGSAVLYPDFGTNQFEQVAADVVHPVTSNRASSEAR